MPCSTCSSRSVSEGPPSVPSRVVCGVPLAIVSDMASSSSGVVASQRRKPRAPAAMAAVMDGVSSGDPNTITAASGWAVSSCRTVSTPVVSARWVPIKTTSAGSRPYRDSSSSPLATDSTESTDATGDTMLSSISRTVRRSSHTSAVVIPARFLLDGKVPPPVSATPLPALS